MEEKIKELRAAIEEAAAAVTDQAQLSDFWQKFLSKNGAVAGLTKSLRDVPKEDRPAVGKTINEFKQCLHINLPVRFRQFFTRFNRVIQCVADYNRQIHHVNLYGR